MFRASLSLMTLALLCLPAQGEAKPLKQLTDAELVEVLLQSPGVKKREEAARLLGERRSAIATDALGRACLDDREGEVCDIALDALMQIESLESSHQLEVIVGSDAVEPHRRSAALAVLGAKDPDRLDSLVPAVLAHYRALEPSLACELVEALTERELIDHADMAVFIAADSLAIRPLRLAALDAAVAFDPPCLYIAYMGLLQDEEKRIRVQCAKGLGNTAYPGEVVVPPLQRSVQTDSAAPVRTAALTSLRYFGHPGLLPVIHEVLLHETNPTTWATALVMLEALADVTSVRVVEKLLQRDELQNDQIMIRLIRIMVMIGEPSTAPVLDVVACRSGSREVAGAAVAGAQLLDYDDGVRLQALSSWRMGVGVYRWDPAAERPDPPTLAYRLDENELLVRID